MSEQEKKSGSELQITLEDANRMVENLDEQSKELLADKNFSRFALGYLLFGIALMSAMINADESGNMEKYLGNGVKRFEIDKKFFLNLLKNKSIIDSIIESGIDHSGIVHRTRNDGSLYQQINQGLYKDFYDFAIEHKAVSEEEAAAVTSLDTIDSGIYHDYSFKLVKSSGSAGYSLKDIPTDELEMIKQAKELALKRAEEIEKELVEQEKS
jgi:hypothetical protein